MPALQLVPVGDGTTDHLPEGTKVPAGLAKTRIRLPRKAGELVVVGRESPSDVRLAIGTVSGTHAAFEVDQEEGVVVVTDLGSVNGTEVDGRRLEPGTAYALRVGDVVSLGDPHLARFEVAEAGANAGDAIADALAGVQKATAEAEETARAVGELLNAGATRAKQAQNAIAGLGDVFTGLRGKGQGNKKKVDAVAPAPTGEDEEGEENEAPLEIATEMAAPEDDEPRSYDEEETVAVEVVPAPADAASAPFSISAEERVMLTPVGWPGPAVELNPGSPIVLGSGRRRGDADVILTADGVDSAHASVLRIGGAVYIEDLGSSSGTFVGGRQIKPGLQYALTQGSDVQLGDGGCAFTITCLDDATGEELNLADRGGGGGRGAEGVKVATVADTAIVPRSPGSSDVEVIDGAELQLSGTDNGEEGVAASPWGMMGGLKGLGDNLGAAIFNSKINVNYQYKPSIQVGGGGPAGLADLKSALLLALADTERGLRADKERKKKIEQLARALEAKNPTRAPLKSPLMNGRWALQYTTALEVIGKGRPGFMRPKGAILQTVDIFTLQVKNEETFEPLPFVKFTKDSVSDLQAQTDSRAAVRPKDYRVAGIKMGAPPKTPARQALDWEMEASGAGSLAWLDTTFVDGEMRISRSQSGDLFILVRDDPNDP